MKLSDLTAGCEICTDAVFTCMRPGIHKVDFDAEGLPFIVCDQGNHYLGGQEGEDGELVGVRPVMTDGELVKYLEIEDEPKALAALGLSRSP